MDFETIKIANLTDLMTTEVAAAFVPIHSAGQSNPPPVVPMPSPTRVKPSKSRRRDPLQSHFDPRVEPTPYAGVLVGDPLKWREDSSGCQP
jgi:hypothetical protein